MMIAMMGCWTVSGCCRRPRVLDSRSERRSGTVHQCRLELKHARPGYPHELQEWELSVETLEAHAQRGKCQSPPVVRARVKELIAHWQSHFGAIHRPPLAQPRNAATATTSTSSPRSHRHSSSACVCARRAAWSHDASALRRCSPSVHLCWRATPATKRFAWKNCRLSKTSGKDLQTN